MRLVRFGEKGQERPGIQKDDHIVDLTSVFSDIPDVCERFFVEGWPEKIKQAQGGKTVELSGVRLGPPLKKPSKIICLGKNYSEHAKEGGFSTPDKPLLFSKAPSALNGPYDPIIFPRSSSQIDWEVELAVVIGKQGKRIDKSKARSYIFGYTVMNDVSGREAQFSDKQWFRGKSFDTFAPMGPSIVTVDELETVDELKLEAFVDGRLMQSGSTRDMLFGIDELLEYISRDITLYPGDVISTGTPSGVGIFRDPPVLLQPGNVVECRIEKIGSLINRCEQKQ